jgi:predicted Zn-dependent protease
MLELDEAGPSLEIAAPTPTLRGAARAEPTAGWGASHHAPAAGDGWRSGASERSAQAQALFDRALVDIEAGNVKGAITLLRQAIALAPGDAQIAEALGKLAFKDRIPGAR